MKKPTKRTHYGAHSIKTDPREKAKTSLSVVVVFATIAFGTCIDLIVDCALKGLGW